MKDFVIYSGELIAGSDIGKGGNQISPLISKYRVDSLQRYFDRSVNQSIYQNDMEIPCRFLFAKNSVL